MAGQSSKRACQANVIKVRAIKVCPLFSQKTRPFRFHKSSTYFTANARHHHFRSGVPHNNPPSQFTTHKTMTIKLTREKIRILRKTSEKKDSFVIKAISHRWRTSLLDLNKTWATKAECTKTCQFLYKSARKAMSSQMLVRLTHGRDKEVKAPFGCR